MNRILWTIAVISLILALGGGAFLLFVVFHPGHASRAKSACEAAVRDRLRSPATASFTGESTSDVFDGTRVSGSVDSQNGFGATVRSDWSCDVDDAGMVDDVTLTQRR